MNRDASCEKSWKQGNCLSNTIKDTSTIMRKGLRMIVLILSSIVLLRGFPRMMHPYTSILNDFGTCILYTSVEIIQLTECQCRDAQWKFR